MLGRRSEDAIIASGDTTTGLVVADNLMVGWKGGCFQAQFWNTPGARIVNNTIWRSQCLGLRIVSDPAPRMGHRAGFQRDRPGSRAGPHDTRAQPFLTADLRPAGVARLGAGSALHVP